MTPAATREPVPGVDGSRGERLAHVFGLEERILALEGDLAFYEGTNHQALRAALEHATDGWKFERAVLICSSNKHPIIPCDTCIAEGKADIAKFQKDAAQAAAEQSACLGACPDGYSTRECVHLPDRLVHCPPCPSRRRE